ncbi:hypothetical protein [Streptomyces acidiscabies]|uniref:hypothetical protein n=1 Tax=Streptomyces acidiscabies TaxID=42234 RepID=UPI0038F6D83A
MTMQTDDQDHGQAPAVRFGAEWTVTPRVAAGVLGIEQTEVHRLIDRDVLAVQYEGRVRLVELDSLLAYHYHRLPAARPIAHPADLDTDKEHRHDH